MPKRGKANEKNKGKKATKSNVPPYPSGDGGVLPGHRHEMPQEGLGAQQPQPDVGGSRELLKGGRVEETVR